MKYIELNPEQWIEAHEQIAEIDGDYADAKDVEDAIVGGLNPDYYYIFDVDDNGMVIVSVE